MGLVVTPIDASKAPKSLRVQTEIRLEGKHLKAIWEKKPEAERRTTIKRVFSQLALDHFPVDLQWFTIPLTVGNSHTKKLTGFSTADYVKLMKVDRVIWEDSVKRYWMAEFKEYKYYPALQKEIEKGFFIAFTPYGGPIDRFLGIEKPDGSPRRILKGTANQIKKDNPMAQWMIKALVGTGVALIGLVAWRIIS